MQDGVTGPESGPTKLSTGPLEPFPEQSHYGARRLSDSVWFPPNRPRAPSCKDALKSPGAPPHREMASAPVFPQHRGR